jgi:hypothetical protein
VEKPKVSAHGRPDLVDFAIKSTFREFTEGGHILRSRDGKYQPIYEDLSERWEACMNFFGKERLKQRFQDYVSSL